MQTGDPVVNVLVTRDGGGVVDLPRADVPLVFASPTGLSFGALRAARSQAAPSHSPTPAADGRLGRDRRDPGGSRSVTAPPTVTVPGDLAVTATGGASVGGRKRVHRPHAWLRHQADPFWLLTTAPKLAGESKISLTRVGVHKGTTAGAPALITRYRYPTTGDAAYPGPERAYRIRIPVGAANAGVAVLSGNVFPHITLEGSEDRLAGYTALPLDLNPYRKSYGARRASPQSSSAGGTYDVRVRRRTAAGGGPFTFRYWVSDVTPPHLHVRSTRGSIVVAATDTGSGVDPESSVATLDGKQVAARFGSGAIRIAAAKGRHRLVLSVADYEEAKNMEDVAKILPNTRTLRASVRVS